MLQLVEYADIAQVIKIKCSGSGIKTLNKQRNRAPILFIETNTAIKNNQTKMQNYTYQAVDHSTVYINKNEKQNIYMFITKEVVNQHV